jgi:hypothetical protein
MILGLLAWGFLFVAVADICDWIKRRKGGK